MAQEVFASRKLAGTVGASLHGHIETGPQNNCLYQRDIKRMSNYCLRESATCIILSVAKESSIISLDAQ